MLTIDKSLGLVTISMRLGLLIIAIIWILVLMRLTTIIAVITTILIMFPSMLDHPIQLRGNRGWMTVLPVVPCTAGPPPPRRGQQETRHTEHQQSQHQDQDQFSESSIETQTFRTNGTLNNTGGTTCKLLT